MIFAPTDQQGTLGFSISPTGPITKMAQARNAYGNAVQELVCAGLGLDPIRINGKAKICFDAKRGCVFYEIKSVRENSKVVVYDWRMAKERDSGVVCRYAVLAHRVRNANSLENMWDQFSRKRLTVFVLSAETVHWLASQCPLKKPVLPVVPPKKRVGYLREGYIDGYRNLPTRELLSHTVPQSVQSVELYGRTFTLQVRCEA